jgi:hypothetical protein
LVQWQPLCRSHTWGGSIRIERLNLCGISIGQIFDVARFTADLYAVAAVLGETGGSSGWVDEMLADAIVSGDSKDARKITRALSLDSETSHYVDQALTLVDVHSRSVITPDLVRRYDFREFYFNIVMCKASLRRGDHTRFVPPKDHYRPRFNGMEPSGVVRQGSSIPIADRIGALPLNVLRVIGKRYDIRGKSRAAIGEQLVDVPEVKTVVERHSDNFFQIQPLDFSMDQFLAEFAATALSSLAIISACAPEESM